MKTFAIAALGFAAGFVYQMVHIIAGTSQVRVG